MFTPKNFLGIDGGGSKTLALIADEHGTVIGRGVAASSNYHTVGQDNAFATLNQAIQTACEAANLSTPAFHAACVGMAGVDRPADRAVMEGWAKTSLAETPVRFVNDAELVLAAGTTAGWGVALICGTGSMIYGRNPEGETARAGGWGYLLGDEGSGYRIGLSALQAVVRAHDDRAAPTLLSGLILKQLTLASPTELVKYIYRERVPTTEIATLAALVEEAAAQQDQVALAILHEAARELALGVKAVAGRLRFSGAIPCAQAGGLILNGTFMRELFRETARELNLNLDPIEPVYEPAQGALRLARRT